jgi:hypothetical protein
VHTVGAVRESHVPAHAIPLLATVSTLGLLDWKLKVSVRGLPAALVAKACRVMVLPTSTLAMGPGANKTSAGMGLGTTRVDEPLLHDRSNPQPARTHTSDVAETNLPMNPSAKKLVLLENSQFRG